MDVGLVLEALLLNCSLTSLSSRDLVRRRDEICSFFLLLFDSSTFKNKHYCHLPVPEGDYNKTKQEVLLFYHTLT